MDAGLQVINQNNFIQIDSKFSNAVLRKSGTITTSNWITNFSFTAKTPLFFYKNTADYVSVRVIKTGVDQYNAIIVTAINTVVKLQYYIFDIVPPTLQTNNYGLQIFNQNGTMVFNSNAYYCRFVDFYTFPDFTLYEDGKVRVFSHAVSNSQTNNLAIMPAYALITWYDSAWGNMMYAPGYNINGAMINMRCITVGFEETSTAISSDSGAEKNNIIVADVGNLPTNYSI